MANFESSASTSSCFRTTDNKYLSCPPRMADGRHFTDYRPSCELDDRIRFDNNVHNSFQYRQFVTTHAEELMNKNRHEACIQNCCGPCTGTDKEMLDSVGTMLPEQSMFVTDGRIMKMRLNDPNGIGTGRQYWTTPQSCEGLPSAWPITGGKSNNCMTENDKLFYLGNYADASLGRVAMPKGGNVPAPVPSSH